MAAVAQEVIQCVVDRPAVHPGAGQAVEVLQRAAVGGQLGVQSPAAAQAEEEKGDAPPGHEARGVDDHRLESAIGQLVEPVVEVGEEVPDGACQQGGQLQGRPFLRLRAVVCVVTRARVNWLISA